MSPVLRTLCQLPFLILVANGCASSGADIAKDKPLEAPVPDLPPDQALKAADANLKVAMAYMQQNDMENANRKLQRALKLAPEYYVTHLVLGRLYQRIRELELAERHFKYALKLKPGDSSALDNYAQFLCAEGRDQEAQEHFLQAAANPLYETPEIPYTNLATCLISADRKAEALRYLLRALQINPQVAQALLHVARLKIEQNDPQTARAYIKRYEAVSQHTPGSLWLAVQIERSLGNRDGQASYEMTLRNLYPDSIEAHNLNRQTR